MIETNQRSHKPSVVQVIKNKTFIVIILIALLSIIACNSVESKPPVTILSGSVSDNYPQLASTPLATAIFTELPKNILLKSGEIELTKQEMDAEISSARDHLKKQYEKNAFFVMEQKFTEKVLLSEARETLSRKGHNIADLSERDLMQTFVLDLVSDIEPSEEEIKEFYDSNKELMGNMPLETVRSQISAFLKQQQQQGIIMSFISNLLSERKIEISANWGSEKIVSAMDNEVDKARVSGRPSMVNFGSDSCVPCQMMIPAREAVKKKLGDRANIVYVHVDREQLLASRYGVQSIPTLIFFDSEGNEIHNHVGVMSQEEMEEWLNSTL